jgi:hypothetical protein
MRYSSLLLEFCLPALGRFIKSEFSPDELPPLIETIFERSDLSDKIHRLSKDNVQAFIDAVDEVHPPLL